MPKNANVESFASTLFSSSLQPQILMISDRLLRRVSTIWVAYNSTLSPRSLHWTTSMCAISTQLQEMECKYLQEPSWAALHVQMYSCHCPSRLKQLTYKVVNLQSFVLHIIGSIMWKEGVSIIAWCPSSLQGLRTVTGTIYIQNNPALTSIGGFSVDFQPIFRSHGASDAAILLWSVALTIPCVLG